MLTEYAPATSNQRVSTFLRGYMTMGESGMASKEREQPEELSNDITKFSSYLPRCVHLAMQVSSMTFGQRKWRNP
jgi:hypothetical protein